MGGASVEFQDKPRHLLRMLTLWALLILEHHNVDPLLINPSSFSGIIIGILVLGPLNGGCLVIMGLH